jgi:cadmium resistance protein CadD (predicted permease)
MIGILGLVAIGGAAFVATNIDDIFVLMMFFSSLTFPVRQVVLGPNWSLWTSPGSSAAYFHLY